MVNFCQGFPCKYHLDLTSCEVMSEELQGKNDHEAVLSHCKAKLSKEAADTSMFIMDQ